MQNLWKFFLPVWIFKLYAESMDTFEPKCIIYCWTPYTPFTMVLEWTIKKMVFATINGGYFVGGKKVYFLMEKDMFFWVDCWDKNHYHHLAFYGTLNWCDEMNWKENQITSSYHLSLPNMVLGSNKSGHFTFMNSKSNGQYYHFSWVLETLSTCMSFSKQDELAC